MSNETNVALVTGANRGIGFEVARQLARRGMTVILGARDLGKGQAAARKLVDEGLEVLPRWLDVTDEASIKIWRLRWKESSDVWTCLSTTREYFTTRGSGQRTLT